MRLMRTRAATGYRPQVARDHATAQVLLFGCRMHSALTNTARSQRRPLASLLPCTCDGRAPASG